MKIFAIMLLMLLSATFLKAQTMLVETVDGMESFEVGEMKGMSAFSQNQFTIWLKIENLPIITLNSSVLFGNPEEAYEANYSYKTFQVCKATTLNNNEFKIHSNSIDFTFYADETIGAAGRENFGSLQFDEIDNLIKSMYIKASGLGSHNDISVEGNFEIELENVPFIFTPLGQGRAVIKGKDIEKVIKRFLHKEVFRNKNNSKSQMEFLKILETQLNDSSILTIDLLY